LRRRAKSYRRKNPWPDTETLVFGAGFVAISALGIAMIADAIGSSEDTMTDLGDTSTLATLATVV
jgi:hypothetical protein